MKLRHHLLLAAISIALWLLFYLVGLSSDYYHDLNNREILMVLLISFFAIIPFIAVIVLTFIKRPFLRTSLWFAFYSSIPLFLLDYIFVGVLKHEGFHFLVSYWYLTIGYFWVWIELPVIGKTLEQLSIKIMNQIV